MTPSQLHALGQFLSDYPCNVTYDKIIELLSNDQELSEADQAILDDIIIWVAFENDEPSAVAEYIENCQQSAASMDLVPEMIEALEAYLRTIPYKTATKQKYEKIESLLERAKAAL